MRLIWHVVELALQRARQQERDPHDRGLVAWWLHWHLENEHAVSNFESCAARSSIETRLRGLGESKGSPPKSFNDESACVTKSQKTLFRSRP